MVEWQNEDGMAVTKIELRARNRRNCGSKLRPLIGRKGFQKESRGFALNWIQGWTELGLSEWVSDEIVIGSVKLIHPTPSAKGGGWPDFTLTMIIMSGEWWDELGLKRKTQVWNLKVSVKSGHPTPSAEGGGRPDLTLTMIRMRGEWWDESGLRGMIQEWWNGAWMHQDEDEWLLGDGMTFKWWNEI